MGPVTDPILSAIEAFLEQHGMTPTAFGKLAAGDPAFVFELRDGREPRRALRDRVNNYMRDYRPPSAPTRAA